MNFTLTGKISIFGGPDDKGMSHSEGLALYEHAEADLRPDLFGPRIAGRGVASRLHSQTMMYFAVRFPLLNREGTVEDWHEGFYRGLLRQTRCLLVSARGSW